MAPLRTRTTPSLISSSPITRITTLNPINGRLQTQLAFHGPTSTAFICSPFMADRTRLPYGGFAYNCKLASRVTCCVIPAGQRSFS